MRNVGIKDSSTIGQSFIERSWRYQYCGRIGVIAQFVTTL